MGQFATPFTGAETELLQIHRLLQNRRTVKVWSDTAPHAAYAGKGITLVQPFSHQFPKDGVLLIAGVHVRQAIWLKHTRFERVVLLYNLSSHLRLFNLVDHIRQATGRDPELVFVSQMLQDSVGLPGRIARSVIDIQQFLDVGLSRSKATLTDRPFTIGRMSRDALDKHSPEDPMLYRMLAAKGFLVRIMGGTCLAPVLDGVEGIELMPAGVESAPDFYRSLDLFFYRTGSSTEAYGRVVVEAMAAGLPVVAHRRGGYVEIINDGVNGYLFSLQEEAFDRVVELAGSPDRRRACGAAAMAAMLDIHGPQAVDRELGQYLR
ncbi:MAG: glycosyltransferase [Pseudomonadota bacterium]